MMQVNYYLFPCHKLVFPNWFLISFFSILIVKSISHKLISQRFFNLALSKLMLNTYSTTIFTNTFHYIIVFHCKLCNYNIFSFLWIFDINNTKKLLFTQMIKVNYYLNPCYKSLFICKKSILPKLISYLSFIFIFWFWH